MKKSVLILLVLLLLPVMAFARAEGEEMAADEPVVFTIGNGAEPQSVDPQLMEGVPGHRIYMSLFEGLTIYDPESGRAIPGVAESWDVDPSNTVYTFTLREGAAWSDGVPITAQTFVDSWFRILDPELAAPYVWFMNMFIKGAQDYNSGVTTDKSTVAIKALDDRHFQFETIGPFPYVIDALPHYVFGPVPLHAIEKYGEQWTLPENFVGNGPYTLDEWRPQEYIKVVPADTYWDKDAVQLDEVIYLPIDDNNTAYSMYLNGEMDWQTTVPLDLMDSAKLRDDYHNAPYLGCYYYLFNNNAAPFDNPKVRKALSLAFDRQTLVDKVTKGGQLPAYGMTPAMDGYPAIDGPENHDLKADIAEAQKLLAEAGYPNGEGWPEVVLLYNTSEAHQKIGEYIQQQWETNLGITVTLTNQEWKTYLATRNAHDFQVARAGWIGDYPDPNTFLDMFLSNTDGNDGQYANADYDTLIRKAATMAAGADRFKTLADAEEIFISEDWGVMPIYHYTSINMIDTSVWGGWYVNVMDYHPTKNIYKK